MHENCIKSIDIVVVKISQKNSIMDKALKYSVDHGNFPAFSVYFNRRVKSALPLNKFIVPWQLEETREEKKDAKQVF